MKLPSSSVMFIIAIPNIIGLVKVIALSEYVKVVVVPSRVSAVYVTVYTPVASSKL